MDPNDNTVSPDSNSPNVPGSPNPQNPIQTPVVTTPDQKTSPDQPPQTPVQQEGPAPRIVNRSPSPQIVQQYPSFEKVDSAPPSYVLKPQQSSTPQDDHQAHYNTQLDAHVIQPTDSPKPKKSKKKVVAIFGLLLFLISIAGSAALAWGVAYNKVELTNYPQAELAIKQVVYSMPFTKKPPEYLIAKTIRAHQDVTRQSFDTSLAIGSDELSDPLGISQLDFQVKGNVDYTDPKNIFFNTEIFLTKGLNIELRKKEKNVYFNIKDIPSFLLAFVGMSKSQFEPVLNKWISWDVASLDTEARHTIDDQETNYLSSEFSDEFFAEQVDDYLLENLTVESAVVDGHNTYKIALNADKEMIDYIQRKLENSSNDSGKFSVLGYTADTPKLSDFVKTLIAEIYIDKSSYYTRKVILSMTIEYDSEEFSGLGLGITGGGGNSAATMAFAAKFDKFGEEVTVEIPAADMTSEEFIEKISVIVSEIYGNMFPSMSGISSPTSSLNNDYKRMSDLSSMRNGLEVYYLDCLSYPQTLDSLLAPGCVSLSSPILTAIPTDPTGTPYYYSSDGSTYHLCANLDTPGAETSPCPDPSYNYHVSSDDF